LYSHHDCRFIEIDETAVFSVCSGLGQTGCGILMAVIWPIAGNKVKKCQHFDFFHFSQNDSVSRIKTNQNIILFCKIYKFELFVMM